MSLKEYPEILALEQLLGSYRIRLEIRPEPGLEKGPQSIAICLMMGTHAFDLFVEDEYGDWDENNQPMCLCLALRELEEYREEADFLDWCRARGYAASNDRARQYHMDLRLVYPEIERLLGEIDSQISDWDFELNAGAAQALREKSLRGEG